MGLSIYIETTIVSYLTARVGRNLIAAAHRQNNLGMVGDSTF
ncbi:MAG TPA: hypothetical protein VGO50_09175 [Pyrinomonadaceae bacterium]|nr:hypothetical protein [Pyrinomonadaceae bacterium]